jgi:hypothetical protein
MLRTALQESGRPAPDPATLEGVYKPVLGLGIAAASEHFAEHPEHLALAAAPICQVCHEPVQTLQVGIDPSRDNDSTTVKVAWPCGHYQPTL